MRGGTLRGAGDLDPRSIYRDRIQRNPEVCSNCFTHLRDVIFPHDDVADKRGEHTETMQSIVRYYTPKRDRTTSAHGTADVSRNPPRECDACGSIGGSTIRPLAKDVALEYAGNLSRTLASFDVRHDPLALRFVVAHRKRFPDYGSRDDSTFELAIATALPGQNPTIRDVLLATEDDPAYETWYVDGDRRGYEPTTIDGSLARAPGLPAP